MIDPDPRGPLRTITKVQQTRSATLVTHDCGHVCSRSQIYSHKVGALSRCLFCGPHGLEPWAVDLREKAKADSLKAGD